MTATPVSPVSSPAAASFGERLRRVREQKALTQGDLAAALGKTQAAISYWEGGRRAPDLDDIVALADVLDVDPSYFFNTTSRKSQRVLLRAEATLRPLRDLATSIEKFAAAAARLPPLSPVLYVVTTDPTRAAQQLLAQARVAAPPVPVDELARQCGVNVLAYAFEDAISGVLLDLDGGPVIGYHRRQSAGRQRFTIAHELGHFVLKHHDSFHIDLTDISSHGEPPGFNYQDERSANDFAAQLLMPAAMATQAFTRRHDVSDLAAQFEVSPQAMGWRLVNLGLIR